MLTHTHVYTLISNIHTHIIQEWGERKKDELEGVEKEEEVETQLERWAMWKTLE